LRFVLRKELRPSAGRARGRTGTQKVKQ